MNHAFAAKLARRRLFRYGTAGLAGAATPGLYRTLTAERAAEAAAQNAPADGIPAEEARAEGVREQLGRYILLTPQKLGGGTHAVELATDAALDLTRPPLDRNEVLWCHLTDYSACQALADAAREAGAKIIRYRSVRDPARGTNLAVLTCSVFAAPVPTQRNTWRIRIGAKGAQAIREFPALGLEFKLADFQSDERLKPLA